uniref:Uncharacterized protein n=1 Tax=Nelumbo nucifera TaxID=4432 RepID=A0A822ZC21_NELNU|nr:TPA_asm: hypothetical protein HUJ06_000687 [Nelumbo nucifera]
MELLLCSLKQNILPNLLTNLAYTRRMELLLVENSEEDEMGSVIAKTGATMVKTFLSTKIYKKIEEMARQSKRSVDLAFLCLKSPKKSLEIRPLECLVEGRRRLTSSGLTKPDNFSQACLTFLLSHWSRTILMGSHLLIFGILFLTHFP